MLVKTVLLIVSNPRRIEKLLSSVQPKVKNTVYIHLLSALTEPFGAFHPDIYNSWPKFSKLIYGIYSQVKLINKVLRQTVNAFFRLQGTVNI